MGFFIMANGTQTVDGQPGRYNATLPTLNDGQGAALEVDSSGRLLVNANGGGGTSITDGRTTVTTAGTRVVLATSTVCRLVMCQALESNTNLVVVGGSDVVAAAGSSRRGMVLYTNDVLVIPIDNLSKIYVDSLVNGEGVRYTYLT